MSNIDKHRNTGKKITVTNDRGHSSKENM
ncbi:hypothetical protein DBR06_SOUSAS24210010, partial [Sousa chinensis]